jgi:hypothetical protein
MLVHRFPEHPLAETSLTWLVQYYSSSEVERWLRAAPQGQLLRGTDGNEVSPALFLASDGNATGVALSSATGMTRLPSPGIGVPSETSRSQPLSHAARGAALGQYVQQTCPALFAEPSVQFPLASLERRRRNSEAEGHYQGLLRSQLAPAWLTCARGEVWLGDGRGLAPKPLLECRLTSQRPRLDGLLNDACWQSACRAELKSTFQDDAEWAAEAWLACDRDFLYWAVRCTKAPSTGYSPATESRPRDANLDLQDRVDLLIDVDRDYASYFRLTIDYRGWTGEACFGEKDWNPQWYVAARLDEQTWVAEAAIPLAELIDHTPGNRDVWAVGLQRTVPGVGFQSWSEPAAVRGLPEGFGLLMFR